MIPVVERILESFALGEGPHWDIATQSLYFVDITKKTVNRYDPVKKAHYQAIIDEGDNVSFIIPIEGRKNHFLISIDQQVVLIVWDGVSDKVSKVEKLASVPDKEVRFNDAKVDPSGRLWLGTMGKESSSRTVSPNKGAFYSFEKSQLKQHFDQVHISNGLAWNPTLKKMYYIDSGRRTVDQFDFDEEAGTIDNRQVIFTLEKHNIPGLPDGQTIDSDGNLWVAVYNGSRIIKIDPRKSETLLATIEMPSSLVTSVEFGGQNLDELYVTTARVSLQGIAPPTHGNEALYKITNTGSKGVPSKKVFFSA